jgi:hypothetical protein
VPAAQKQGRFQHRSRGGVLSILRVCVCARACVCVCVVHQQQPHGGSSRAREVGVSEKKRSLRGVGPGLLVLNHSACTVSCSPMWRRGRGG